MSSSSASWARSAPGSTAPVTSASPARKDGKARWYNGHTLAHINCTYGLKKNGVEHVGPAITRGALIDMVDLKGRKMKKGELITPEDIEATVKKAGVAPISEGDVGRVQHRLPRHRRRRGSIFDQEKHRHGRGPTPDRWRRSPARTRIGPLFATS